MAFNPRTFLKDFDIPPLPKRLQRQVIRPFATRYYNDVSAKQEEYSACGAATEQSKAVRSAVWRVLDGQYAKALVFDRATGRVVRWINPTDGVLQVVDVKSRYKR